MKGCLGVPTTLATGHLQNLAYYLIAKLDKDPKVDWNKTAVSASVVLGVVLGATFGAFVNFEFGRTHWSTLMMTPVVALLGILLVADDMISDPPHLRISGSYTELQ